MSAETGHRGAASRTEERGFALVAVLLVLALVGTAGAEFAFSMRVEARAARAYKESVTATHLACQLGNAKESGLGGPLYGESR